MLSHNIQHTIIMSVTTSSAQSLCQSQHPAHNHYVSHSIQHTIIMVVTTSSTQSLCQSQHPAHNRNVSHNIQRTIIMSKSQHSKHSHHVRAKSLELLQINKFWRAIIFGELRLFANICRRQHICRPYTA